MSLKFVCFYCGERQPEHFWRGVGSMCFECALAAFVANLYPPEYIETWKAEK